METITKDELDKVASAFEELKRTVETKTLDHDKIEKINIVLDSYEKKNQELARAIEAQKTHEANLKAVKDELETKGVEAGKIREQLDALELAFAKSTVSSSDRGYRETAEYKALDNYIRYGGDVNAMSVETKAALRTDSATDGGVLVTSEMEANIVKMITEIDPMRSICRVRPVSSKSLVVPIRTGIPTAQYEGEAETGTDSKSAYGSETLTAFRLTHTVPITRDMLMDASFDMEMEIMSDSAEAFAYGEGNGFVLGTGFKAPQGFLSDTRITSASVAGTGGATGVVGADDPIKLQGELKTGYVGTFVLNRRTLAQLRMKKSTDGVYLWQPGLNGPASATIAGSPYILANSMPDLAANSYSIAFGAFNIGYLIIDRTATEVIRDDYSLKKSAQVEFTIHRWNTGKVVLPEAIKVIKIPA